MRICPPRPAFAILMVALADCAFGLNPSLSLTQFIHTSWTESEGAMVPYITAVAQSTDGYLWLGTRQGLLRFDGLHLVPWNPLPGEALPDKSIDSLAASAGGGLWIGTKGRIVRLEHGHLVQYTIMNGSPDGGIAAMVEDRAGRLWAGNVRPKAKAGGLVLLDNGRVKTYGTENGLQKPEVLSLFFDHEGTLWVGTLGGFCKWDAREARCHPVRPPFAAAQDAETLGPPAQKPFRLVKAILQDRQGTMWLGTVGQGLIRVRDDRFESFSRKDGLSSDDVEALAEDREGNLWVGTSNGFDRFREPKVAKWTTFEGLSGNFITAVCSTRGGDVWVGAFSRGLNRIRGNQIVRYSRSSGLPNDTVFSLHEDVNGTLWAGTGKGLARLSGERFVEVPVVDHSPFLSQTMTSVRSGVLWLADSNRGLARLRDGRVEEWQAEGMPSDAVYRLGSSRNGDLWVGYIKDGIAVIRGDSVVQTYTAETGLAAGAVQAIYEDRAGSMWIGTREGLSRIRNGRWTTWTAKQRVPLGGIQAMTEDDGGHLWLVTPAGMLLLTLEDLSRTPDGVPASLFFSTYGPDDGIRIADIPGTMDPRLAKSVDGRLWLSTGDGVATIDPASIRTNTLAPPISIEQLIVDGKRMDVTAHDIRFRGRAVQIDYTALSLTSPEAVRFRYQLEGFDRDWVEAGTRRQIVYANLPPADYRFHVIASNNDGVWNQEGAVLSFRCEPYFYQTRLFSALCLCALGLSVWGVVRLRVGQIRSRFQLVLAERTRLTREMHDTLLQGFAGVVYQLEAASRQAATAPDLSKKRVERALEQADQSLREAREALSSMRLSALEHSTLSEALLATGKQILEGTPARFDMDVTGRVRQLPYDIQANLYIIAREAINNALNHARPESVTLELAYSRDSVRLTVEDDGVGFDPDNTPVREDHWGLGGMRERARLIGARLTVQSERGLGTKIAVVVDRGASKSRG